MQGRSPGVGQEVARECLQCLSGGLGVGVAVGVGEGVGVEVCEGPPVQLTWNPCIGEGFPAAISAVWASVWVLAQASVWVSG